MPIHLQQVMMSARMPRVLTQQTEYSCSFGDKRQKTLKSKNVVIYLLIQSTKIESIGDILSPKQIQQEDHLASTLFSGIMKQYFTQNTPCFQ